MGKLDHALYSDGVEVNVAGEDGQIAVFVHEDALVSSLVEMPDPLVSPIVITGVGDVEVAHELAEVGQGGLKKQVEVVCHQDVAVKLDGVDVQGLAEDLEELFPVAVIAEDFSFFIAPASDVIDGVGILDTKRSGHAWLSHTRGKMSITKI